MGTREEFEQIIEDMIDGERNGETLSVENFDSTIFEDFKNQKEDFWIYILDYMKGRAQNLIAQSELSDENDTKGIQASIFGYTNEKADIDRFVSDFWERLLSKYNEPEKLTNDENSASGKISGDTNYYWNESVSKAIVNFLLNFDRNTYEAKEQEDLNENGLIKNGDYDPNNEGNVVSFKNGIKVGGNIDHFHISDLINADAGFTFDTGPWVKPQYNVDGELYKNVRGVDKILSVLKSSKDLQYTVSQNNDPHWLRLLMPKYMRNVEVEDLNRNFWVIGQSIAALSAFLFEDSPITDLLKRILNEIAQLWQNIMYLWATMSMIMEDDKTYNVHTEVIVLPNDELQSYRKFDNFEDTNILQLNNETIVKIENRLMNYVDRYPMSNVAFIPCVRDGNYKHNFYSKEIYYGIFFYSREKEIWTVVRFNPVITITVDKYEELLTGIREKNDFYQYFRPLTASLTNIGQAIFYGLINLDYKCSSTFAENEIKLNSFNLQVYDRAGKVVSKSLINAGKEGIENINNPIATYTLSAQDISVSYGEIVSVDVEEQRILSVSQIPTGNDKTPEVPISSGYYQGELISSQIGVVGAKYHIETLSVNVPQITYIKKKENESDNAIKFFTDSLLNQIDFSDTTVYSGGALVLQSDDVSNLQKFITNLFTSNAQSNDILDYEAAGIRWCNYFANYIVYLGERHAYSIFFGIEKGKFIDNQIESSWDWEEYFNTYGTGGASIRIPSEDEDYLRLNNRDEFNEWFKGKFPDLLFNLNMKSIDQISENSGNLKRAKEVALRNLIDEYLNNLSPKAEKKFKFYYASFINHLFYTTSALAAQGIIKRQDLPIDSPNFTPQTLPFIDKCGNENSSTINALDDNIKVYDYDNAILRVYGNLNARSKINEQTGDTTFLLFNTARNGGEMRYYWGYVKPCVLTKKIQENGIYREILCLSTNDINEFLSNQIEDVSNFYVRRLLIGGFADQGEYKRGGLMYYPNDSSNSFDFPEFFETCFYSSCLLGDLKYNGNSVGTGTDSKIQMGFQKTMNIFDYAPAVINGNEYFYIDTGINRGEMLSKTQDLFMCKKVDDKWALSQDNWIYIKITNYYHSQCAYQYENGKLTNQDLYGDFAEIYNTSENMIIDENKNYSNYTYKQENGVNIAYPNNSMDQQKNCAAARGVDFIGRSNGHNYFVKQHMYVQQVISIFTHDKRYAQRIYIRSLKDNPDYDTYPESYLKWCVWQPAGATNDFETLLNDYPDYKICFNSLPGYDFISYKSRGKAIISTQHYNTDDELQSDAFRQYLQDKWVNGALDMGYPVGED